MRAKRVILLILTALLFAVSASSAVSEGNGPVQEGAQEEEQNVDVGEILFGHIGDSYGWHITDWNGKHISIPLPCIVRSSDGWHIFMSSEIAHGEEYEGLRIAEGGRFDGKLVEVDENGEYIRPFDISITKNVASLIISAILLISIVLSTANWYRKNDAADESPGGFTGLMEMMVMMVNDDLIKSSIGEKHYRQYAPYLLTAFFFIFLTNLLGIVPFFPGGANVTGNIAVTLVLAMCTFLSINLFANKQYWKDILWPEGPIFLKFPIPIMQTIEIFGIFTKPFSLMVRLFANILAGHAMILGLVSVIFVTAKLGPVINRSMTFITMLFGIFMDCLELLVAFIQAYVFTMLSAVFIGLSRQEEQA